MSQTENQHTLESTGNMFFSGHQFALTIPTIDHQLQNIGTYHEINVIGDGNCALNALALLLITASSQLSDEALTRLMNEIKNDASMHILKERQALYSGQHDDQGAAYVDLAAPLLSFISFMTLCKDVAYFKTYIQRIRDMGTREEIAALMVGFAPALRLIGYSEYVRSSEVNRNADYQRDGIETGDALLDPLARIFGVMLYTLDTESEENTAGRVTTSGEHQSRVAVLALAHHHGHWNALIPASEMQTAFAKKLKTPSIKKELDVIGNIKEAKRNDIVQQVDEAHQVVATVIQHNRLTDTQVWVGKEQMALEKLSNICAADADVDADVDLDLDLNYAKLLQNEEILKFLDEHCNTLLTKHASGQHASEQVEHQSLSETSKRL